MDNLPTPAQLAQNLVDLLDVEEIDTDLYRGIHFILYYISVLFCCNFQTLK